MSTAVWVVVAVVIVAVLAVVGYLVWSRSRSRRLRQQFGPEYDRTVEQQGSRSAAEKELQDRSRRHQELELRELEPARREEYREEWTKVQERFVDAPEAAVEEADRLVTRAMGERGYPTGDFDENVVHLSVEHGRTLDHYRRAHEISERAGAKQAPTEELRQAMVHYRALFEDLLAVPADERATAPAVETADRPDESPAERTAPGEPVGAEGDRGHRDRAAAERRDDEQTPRS
ncbi:hypothetical protein [Actinomadura parmotrematis]|uniref:Secreted protein n=1 Tax=Actinomadura parmotrematis TaxID=2864039 RepID=A0ABS7G329_9ACTN|nr:hypothetical protein [Actinomadura parmotrematis]MBW8487130.1 hypothetical protein [Actinomadura parmotrematis]